MGEITAQLPRLLAWHESRVQRDRDYQGLLEDLAKARERRKNNVISLNETKRRKERADPEARLSAMLGSAGAGADRALADDGLQFNERKLSKDLAIEKTQKSVNDVLLNEAVSILSDSAALKEGKSQMAAAPCRPVLSWSRPCPRRHRSNNVD
ncbi:carboxy terminal-processing peptidase [Roseateles violae]|uniref:Carboxy terminal-processing peptidase n=1 Tax=Roseateles violae TaxID=3058042 RepID=A0ABT8E093_9BURK|nr:carboxy terminal-processing peptidase [Pelomonas sp. PFR6]MDN3923283.1 carboxy terminal-processing peptidase [Pelomonas sp. PFR6]